MPETLTRGEAQTVLNDLKNELSVVKNTIERSGIIGGAAQILSGKQKELQDQINKILEKGGMITEEDYNASYDIIRGQAKQKADALNKKTNTRLLMIVGGSILLIAGVMILTRQKK